MRERTGKKQKVGFYRIVTLFKAPRANIFLAFFPVNTNSKCKVLVLSSDSLTKHFRLSNKDSVQDSNILFVYCYIEELPSPKVGLVFGDISPQMAVYSLVQN